MNASYFKRFEHRMPGPPRSFSRRRQLVWQFLASVTIGLGLWYLHWRWTATLNPDAPVFSVLVALAETGMFVGTLLFFHDIWRQEDTPPAPAPGTRAEAALDGDGPILVDIFITTYDEDAAIVEPSVIDALAVRAPAGCEVLVHLLDDGQRPEMRRLAERHGIRHHTRPDNRGFKAGNLRNALFESDGDFVVICDADTRLLPAFLEETLGYFRDPRVAWVQTPHWFYDIPEGETWAEWCQRRLGIRSNLLARGLSALTGRDRVGGDPFRSDPGLFFDVIQRRRNRNGASFCCGAGSIHRREALFHDALRQVSRDATRMSKTLRLPRGALTFVRPRLMLQPFRFHVSEDIYTSILLQSDRRAGWKSVYHPAVLARMLSPWSMEAWAAQRLKYAGGTLDILFHDNPLFRRGMPAATRLHYAATFWSYLSSVWLVILLAAPVWALATGSAPLSANPLVFFAHLVPLLVANELALLAGCNGHDVHSGRILSIACIPYNLRALWLALRRRRVEFRPTPKIPLVSPALDHVRPHLALLVTMAAVTVWALVQERWGEGAMGRGFLVANLFWLGWNATALVSLVAMALWRPPAPAERTPRECPNGAVAKAK